MMKHVIALAILAMLAPTSAAQAHHHHHPLYLMGGFETPTTVGAYPRGLYLFDKTGAAPTLRKLCDVPYTMSMQHNVQMDYDNRSLIGFTRGVNTTLYPWAGCLCRFDAGTTTWTSLVKFPSSSASYPQAYFFEHGMRPIIDQDGDYLFMKYRMERITSPTTVNRYDYRVLRFDRNARTLSTLLTTVQVPVKLTTGLSQLGKDIDTGRVLIGGWQDTISPHRWSFPVWTLDPEKGYDHASLGYWNDGSVYGWGWAGYNLEQNVKNGYLQGLGDSIRYVNQLKPGSHGMTTIAAVTGYPYSQVQHGARFDLQTAASPRFLLGGFYSSFGAWLLQFDVNTWALTTFDSILGTTQVQHPYLYWQDFYRGRHIQTVRVGKDRWNIRLSCPQHPKMPYVLVASLAGVRPGVKIPGGRRINLNPDMLTHVTLAGWAPGIWSSGPGRLDSSGEAVGILDVSLLYRPKKGWGMPLWIAMAVIDPQAPGGIAYLPDTYVMRL